MVKLVNRAKMKVASGGAGTLTLGTACDGYQTFAAGGVTDQDKLRYTITDGNDWEIGVGTYTASGTTLARAPTESSNSGNAITCSSEAEIFVTMAAEDFTGNVAPIWVTLPETTKSLENDGSTAVTLTGVAIDEGGFPIQYSWDGFSGSTVYSDASLPPQLHSAPTISTSGVASLIGSSTSSNAGTFSFRLKASDGVKTATATTVCELAFMYDTNLVGWYDAADTNSYSGSGSTISDKSGNSGPTLAIAPGYNGNTAFASSTYNSSGIGSLPSITYSGFMTFSTTNDFGTGCTVIIISKFTRDNQTFLGGSGTGGSGSMTYQSGSSTASQAFAASSNISTSASEIFVDKTSLGTGATPTRAAVYTGLLGSGAGSTAAGQLHSLAQTNLDLTNGYSLGAYGANDVTGELRAVLIYARNLTQSQIASVHNYYKGFYSSDSDMAP